MSPEVRPMTLVLATDSFLIGDGLARMLAQQDAVTVVGRARDHDELVRLVDAFSPDAVLITIRTPVVATLATIAGARHLREAHPDLGIVVASDRGSGFALEFMREGSSRVAYLLDEHLPSMEVVVGALREVRVGQTVLDPSIVDALIHRRNVTTIDDLTPREIDMLELIARGRSNRGIAGELHLSVKGIEKHVTTIFRKLTLVDQSLVDRRMTAALTFLRTRESSIHAGAAAGPAAGRVG